MPILGEVAEKILRRKYYAPNEDFNGLCLRVATAIASVENTKEEQNYWSSRYYELLNNLWFLPGGRVLANAGKPGKKSLFNCGVLAVEDSRDSIYDTLKTSAELFAHGAGIGINFSPLREKGAPVSNGSVASGPVSFMQLFNYSAGIISQTSRRGGFLGLLECNHPDVSEFISAKDVEGQLTRFNLSVGITDAFMQAVVADEEIDIISRYDAKVVDRVNAKKLLMHIATHAWKSGDPGIIFLDALDRDNPTPHLGKLRSTNLCGESPLLESELCNLGAINLTKMLVKQDDATYLFDETRLAYTVILAVRFLDSVHDVSEPILSQTDIATKRTRKLGLGVMGWADCLVMLGLSYDSEEALVLADNIATSMKQIAYETSKLLAEEKGAYPGFDVKKSKNIWFPEEPVTPTRNATFLSLPPTGSVSLVAGVNSSIEPFFALAYLKHVTEGDSDVKFTIVEFNKYLTEYLKDKPYRDDVEQMVKDGLPLPDYMGEVFKTAHDISPGSHIRMQAVWQSHIDMAVSKTINLCSKATAEDIFNVILLGWGLGIKGMTVFRDGCREMQILQVGNS